MKVLALALASREKSCQGQDVSLKTQAMWLLYVNALLTLSVAWQSLISCLGMLPFKYLHVN